jgi:hypothetical protein
MRDHRNSWGFSVLQFVPKNSQFGLGLPVPAANVERGGCEIKN